MVLKIKSAKLTLNGATGTVHLTLLCQGDESPELGAHILYDDINFIVRSKEAIYGAMITELVSQAKDRNGSTVNFKGMPDYELRSYIGCDVYYTK